MRIYLAFCIGYAGECGKQLVEIGCAQIEDKMVDDFLKAFCEILGDGKVIAKRRYKYYPEWYEVEPMFRKAMEA